MTDLIMFAALFATFIVLIRNQAFLIWLMAGLIVGLSPGPSRRVMYLCVCAFVWRYVRMSLYSIEEGIDC